MTGLSIIIPSRTDTYLRQTVNDLFDKAEGDIQVIVVLDGYWPSNFSWVNTKVTIVHHGTLSNNKGMRFSINSGMSIAKGDYVMKLDEHCMFDKGFDKKLIADCGDDWVVVPRRYRLDAETWKVIEDGRPPIDYMFIENKDGYLHGTIWGQRAEERKDILIDDLMTFQGSCWFLKKSYWEKIGPMDDENYGPFANEAQEIGNKAWLSGGRVVVNKKTWYAHWHRNSANYSFTNEQRRKFDEGVKKGREYSSDFWLNNKWEKRVHDYQWLVDKFSPLPK